MIKIKIYEIIKRSSFILFFCSFSYVYIREWYKRWKVFVEPGHVIGIISRMLWTGPEIDYEMCCEVKWSECFEKYLSCEFSLMLCFENLFVLSNSGPSPPPPSYFQRFLNQRLNLNSNLWREGKGEWEIYREIIFLICRSIFLNFSSNVYF